MTRHVATAPATKRALLLAAAASVSLLAASPPAAVTEPAPWQVTITQVDSTGKRLTDPVGVACPPSGCEKVLQLFVDFKSHQFIAGITFVDKGAYVALQPMARELGQVVDFQRGFRGPVFVKVRDDENNKTDTLRFTLTGPAVPEAGKGSAPLMTNPHSLVYHRKLEPDMILRIELVRPAAAS